MNVSDQIIQVLDNLCEKFGLAIDWTSENVIPYLTTLCTKLVTYEIWTSVAWLVLAIVAGITAIVMFTRPRIRQIIREETFGYLSLDIALLLLGAFSILGIITQTMDIIKCVTFPEMYIFEYIQNLIKNVQPHL